MYQKIDRKQIKHDVEDILDGREEKKEKHSHEDIDDDESSIKDVKESKKSPKFFKTIGKVLRRLWYRILNFFKLKKFIPKKEQKKLKEEKKVSKKSKKKGSYGLLDRFVFWLTGTGKLAAKMKKAKA